MFEQKINTVSIRVNEESFAVVPFDNYKDAVQAAKQALVALNNGERVELLGKRLDAVERALGDKLTCGIAAPYVSGILISELPSILMGEGEALYYKEPAPKAEKPKREPKGWLRESINGVTRAITTEPEVAEIWVAAGRKVTPLYE